MIRVARPPLTTAVPDSTVQTALAARQQLAGSGTVLGSVITSRWNSFVRGAGRDAGVGPVVCEAVRTFCKEKCAYCESPKAATVDHVWPKSDYQSKMFDWDNLLAACRDCNSEKRSGFPLDATGNPVLIDPSSDEPLQHFRWDHVTGECQCAPNDPRAKETHTAFALNRLKTERLNKLDNFRFLLVKATEENPASAGLLERLRAELDEGRPYLGILRSYLLYPPTPGERALVKVAVTAVPAILTWAAPWLRPPTGAAWPP